MQRPHVRLCLCAPAHPIILSSSLHSVCHIASSSHKAQRPIVCNVFVTRHSWHCGQWDSGTDKETYSGTVCTTLDNCQSRVDIVTAFGPLFILFSFSLSLSLPLSLFRLSLFIVFIAVSLIRFFSLLFWLLVNTQIKLYAWILFQPARNTSQISKDSDRSSRDTTQKRMSNQGSKAVKVKRISRERERARGRGTFSLKWKSAKALNVPNLPTLKQPPAYTDSYNIYTA